MFEKTLPIGSVVTSVGGTKKMMIVGYYQYLGNDHSKTYDYVAVGYPEGFLNSETMALFDHSSIEHIYSIGYQDEDRFEFEQKLKQAIKVSDEGK